MSFIAAAKSKNVLGATLLVTGCCIGSGMIGLPVISAFAGLIPSSLVMLGCYLFTTLTGLLLLEVTLWFDQEVNLLSIVQFAFGKIGKLITWVLFLALFYCIFIAYFEGLSDLVAAMLSRLFHHPVSRSVAILFCAVVVGSISYLGTRSVEGINRYLVAGLVISYGALILLGLPYVTGAHLAHQHWAASLATVPILFICFGYQNLVPGLTHYLEKNVNAIRFAIIVGNLLALIIYAVWNFVIIGMLPTVDLSSKQHVETVTTLLQGVTGSVAVMGYVKAFSLFAILSSFLPSALSFVSFLKDGFKQTSVTVLKQDIFLQGLIFIPPMMCAIIYPDLFLRALSFAGGFIDVLLFAVLPAAVILVGRAKRQERSYQVMGGYITPAVVLILSFIILYYRF